MTDRLADTNPEPQCDVVVVNYNAGDFLLRCVESALRSDIPISLTVVDNASSDDSIEKISELAAGQHRYQVFQNSENLGFAKAVNQGARLGNSPYVFLLNPDCEIHPHTLRNMLSDARRCEDFGIMGALVFNEDGTEQRGCRRLEPTFVRSVVTALRLGKYFQSVNLQHEPLPEGPQSIDAVSGSSMLIDRRVFERLDGMDEGYFLHVEDLDICRRAREHGYKVYFTPNVSLFHHHGASSKRVPYRTEWYKHQGMLRYQGKFQKPHQSAVRSLLTRGVIYLNYLLSITRYFLTHWGSKTPETCRLVGAEKPIVVTGASSDLGQAVLAELKREHAVIAVSRSSKFPAPLGGEVWFNWSYFEKVPPDDFPGARAWLALSPVWAAPDLARTLGRLGEVQRTIALSSTSIMGKADTADSKEQEVVQRLIDGEQGLLQWANDRAGDLTICRASMIYGGKSNQNIAFIQRMIRWFRFFPMVSQGNGMRQPVHIDDLATALHSLVDRSGLPDDIYVLAGGEQLSYRHMIERIFHAMNRTERFWVIPEQQFKRAVDVLSHLPGLGFLNREMISRMEKNLVYDIEPARRDFEYAPGMFRPE